MKAIALVTTLVFSLLLAGGQGYLIPLTVQGSYSTKDGQTKYVIELENRSKRPIEGMRIRKAGMYIHNQTFSPEYRVPTIPAGRKYMLTVWVRGTVSIVNDTADISVQGWYYQGTQRIDMFLRTPKDCPPPMQGG